MFKLFKARNFSDYINDTFDFFKVEGKNFLKNYFIINGGFLIVTLILSYFIFEYFSISTISFYNYYYLNDSIPLLLFLLVIAAFVLLLIVSTISYTYPTLYLKNMEKYPGQKITTQMIFNDLKDQSGRIFIFILGGFFIIIPIATIILGISVLLIIIIIGIPLLIISPPLIISWTSLSYNEYIIKKTPFIESLGSGIKMLRNDFWPIIGSTTIIYLIIQIALTILTIIPQIYLVINTITTLEEPSNLDSSLSGSFFIYIIIYIITILGSLILNNLLLINQGLIYYSQREKIESITTKIDIELIGKTDE